MHALHSAAHGPLWVLRLGPPSLFRFEVCFFVWFEYHGQYSHCCYVDVKGLGTAVPTATVVLLMCYRARIYRFLTFLAASILRVSVCPQYLSVCVFSLSVHVCTFVICFAASALRLSVRHTYLFLEIDVDANVDIDLDIAICIDIDVDANIDIHIDVAVVRIVDYTLRFQTPIMYMSSKRTSPHMYCCFVRVRGLGRAATTAIVVVSTFPRAV